jgi:chromosomal replication initiator protein
MKTNSKVTFKNVEKIICTVLLTTPEEMHEKTRRREVVKARQLSMLIMRKYTKNTLATIGWYYRKDHATVLHSLRVIENLLDINDHYYAEKIIQVMELVETMLVQDREAMQRLSEKYQAPAETLINIYNDLKVINEIGAGN